MFYLNKSLYNMFYLKKLLLHVFYMKMSLTNIYPYLTVTRLFNVQYTEPLLILLSLFHEDKFSETFTIRCSKLS